MSSCPVFHTKYATDVCVTWLLLILVRPLYSTIICQNVCFFVIVIRSGTDFISHLGLVRLLLVGTTSSKKPKTSSFQIGSG